MTDAVFITPPPLQEGDTIAIVSPSSIVKPEYVYEAKRVLEREGWSVEVYPHALGQSGSFAGTFEERLKDISDAFMNPRVKAILCARGGYGAVHLLEPLNRLPLRNNPKWLIGFSDITALHGLILSNRIESIHASMVSRLAKTEGMDIDSRQLFDILRGRPLIYSFNSHSFNNQGVARGRLVGGNLAVLADLIATPFDLLAGVETESKRFAPDEDIILFIEDINEPIYKVNRIMYQLRMAGVLDNVKGLIFGQFTDYKPSNDFNSMEEMLVDLTRVLKIPVVYDAPIGHADRNIPLVEGRVATLRVGHQIVEISQQPSVKG